MFNGILFLPPCLLERRVHFQEIISILFSMTPNFIFSCITKKQTKYLFFFFLQKAATHYCSLFSTLFLTDWKHIEYTNGFLLANPKASLKVSSLTQLVLLSGHIPRLQAPSMVGGWGRPCKRQLTHDYLSSLMFLFLPSSSEINLKKKKIFIFLDLSEGFDTVKSIVMLKMFYSCGFYNK